MKMELFKQKFNAGYSTQLLNINTTKFQVEREPV